MASFGMERFDAAGLVSTWWDQSVFEFQTAVSRGWRAVVEAWLTTAEAGRDDMNAPDPADQIAVKLLACAQLDERAGLVAEHARLDAEIKAAESASHDDGADDGALSPAELKALKSERTKAKKKLGAIDSSLLATARENLDDMKPEDAPAKVIGVLNNRLEALVDDHYAVIERTALAWYDNLIAKYGTTLGDLETERDDATARLQKHLRDLDYE
ncbi:MAG: hypothetical protein OXF75_02750 [Acidimicrobiaceae bacterium]|nr:hypothetical protein [Acidimicrobiaceae bacterium]